MLKRLIVHVSNYSAGSLLVTLASIVSFPILTRLLTVDEYGVMNLVATALSLLVGVAKLGVQHSAVRFYSEIKAGKRDVGLEAYVSTVVFGMAGVGLIATLLWAGASQLVPDSFWNDARLKPLLLLTAGLVFIRVVDSSFINQLRAEERSREITVYSVVRRYAGLALLLFVMFFVARDLWGFYAATIIGEAAATLALAAWMWKRLRPRLRDFDAPLFRSMLAFGIPMIGYELASIILSMGDRYVIQALLGAEPLGFYSAAYNLCDYVRMIFLASFGTAVLPMYVRMWEEKGRDETAAFLRRFMHVYVMVAMLVVAGLSAVGAELIAFLASEKYRAGAQVVPYVIGGMALEGLVMVAGAGLYIEKRTKTVMLLVVACAAVNIGLNLVLIPAWGLVGAAAATLIAYAGLLASSMFLGRRRLPVRIPLVSVLKFGGIALAMYLVLVRIEVGSDFATLAVRMATGAALYVALTLLVDAEARQLLSTGWNKLRRVNAGPAATTNTEPT
jgi:O-antigen/teichoic acid export membrane protein